MAVLRWDPWGELAAIQRDMNQLVGRTARGDVGGGSLVPAIDAFRTEEALVVQVELPGMQAENVDIQVQDGVLTISGERRPSGDVPEEAWVRRERAVGQFERSFTLPEGTDPDRITASFEHGILEIAIPHPPEQKPRRIQIDAGNERDVVDVG